MGYYDDIIFLDCGEYPDYRTSVFITPRKEPQWEFALHTHGNLILQRDRGRIQRFSSPVLFWRAFNQYYRHGIPDGESRGHLYLVTSGSRAERAYQHLAKLFPEGFLLLEEESESFRKILAVMREILNTVWLNDEKQKHIAASGFETLIAEATRIYYSRRPDYADNNRMLKLADSIRANPIRDYDFQNVIAQQFGMSYHSFRVLFRKATGKAPRQFVMKCRLHYALELLNSTDLQVKEIADRCGFENPISFFRFFKKSVGVTPLHYRHHLHSDYLQHL